MKYYAGIGSRQTPDTILSLMEILAAMFVGKFVLRSGGAKGADKAFEKGCDFVKGKKEIFRAEDCTEEAMELSSKFHPNWKACSPYARQLHGRNAMILLGKDLKTPCDFVVCWTPEGEESGGTGQGMRIATAFDIPIYNLYFPEHFQKLKEQFFKSEVGDIV